MAQEVKAAILQLQIRGHLISLKQGPGGLEIGVAGYGESAAPDGAGMPIYVDLEGDHPRVHVWGDINNEDPTTISLEGAQEVLRANDDKD